MPKAAPNTSRTLQRLYTILLFRRLLYRIEITVPTVTVLIMEDAKTREAKQGTTDKWPQSTNCGSWKISFKSEVSHSSQYLRAGMLWSGDVEDANSDDLITSASFTGKPIPDFENLDFKIVQAQSEKRITCGQTDCFDDLRFLQYEWRQ